MMRRTDPPRLGDPQFLGVVRAIAHEVASEQRMQADELIGEAHRLCAAELAKYDPSKCSTFAHRCFATVKLSMIRDISRQRRKDKGEKVDGGDRPTRKHTREVLGGEIVVRNGFGGGDGGLASTTRPDWWGMLTAQQRSIVLLTERGMRPARIARYLGLGSEAGEAIVERELACVQAVLIRAHVVEDAWVEDMIEEQAENDRAAGTIKGASKWTLAATG